MLSVSTAGLGMPHIARAQAKTLTVSCYGGAYEKFFREHLLPERKRGYYREYTVSAPGARDRGPRRIVAGHPAEYYYTDDHYRSFRSIREE